MATVEQDVNAHAHNGAAPLRRRQRRHPRRESRHGQDRRDRPRSRRRRGRGACTSARRAAQPGWEAIGFEGRGRILLRAQKWLIDNSERVIDTIVSETGKTYEDAEFAEIAYAANAFGFWAKEAPELPRRRARQIGARSCSRARS